MTNPTLGREGLEKITLTLADGGLRDAIAGEWEGRQEFPINARCRLARIDARARGMMAVYKLLMRDRCHTDDQEDNDNVEYRSLPKSDVNCLDDAMQSLLLDQYAEIETFRTETAL
jgi:hypothetical protein